MKLGQFKQLIEEAVRKVVKEELKGIRSALLEQNTILQPHKKVGGFTSPNYSEINSIPTSKHSGINIEPKFQTTGDPLIDLLNETKFNTTSEDWQNFGNFGQESAQHFNPNSFIHGNEPVVGTVGDMLQHAPKTNDINAINIDVVPNFSKLMSNMKEKGTI